jgi:hypothetical protein
MKPAKIADLSPDFPLAGLNVAQFQGLLLVAVADVLRRTREETALNAAGLSADGAAKLSKTRRDHVLQALKNGGLPGTRQGSRWSVTVGDVRQWIEDGKPVAAVVKAG